MNKKGRLLKLTAIILASVSLLFLTLIVAVTLYSSFAIDYDTDESLFENARIWNSTVFYSEINADGEHVPSAVEYGSGLKKLYFEDENITEYVKKGFIAVEDRDFYQHSGVDILRTLKAALNYITGGEKLFGASTITQQLIKNLSGDNDLSIRRKLNEILRARHIEKCYTKDEILELYLNIIPMSENIYGVGMASRSYFGKNPSELSAAEAATLIGITNAPTAYNPYSNPEACLSKRNKIIGIMYSEQVIDEETYMSALAEPLGVIPRSEQEGRVDSWFLETVISDASLALSEKLGISKSAASLLLLGGGYSVYTTMDESVQSILDEYFSDLSNFPSAVSDGLEYSMVICDSENAKLRGIVGAVGEKRANRILNHATVPHVPASTLKPLALYAPLIDNGMINWSTVFDDTPISFTESAGEYIAYPKNSPNNYSGLITVADAVRKSKNTVAVRLCQMYGEKNVFRDLKSRFGFTTLAEGASGITDSALAPMALGQLSYGVPLTELTSAYTVFPSYGVYNKPRSFIKIIDAEGNTVVDNLPDERRVFSESTAKIMNMLLSRVVQDGTARTLMLSDTVATAGKTGTSSGAKDKLFIGYTPYYTAGIWCGFSGGSRSVAGYLPTHLEIWDAVMNELHTAKMTDDTKNNGFNIDGIEYLPYCTDSGKLFSDVCRFDPRGSRLAYGYFTRENKPTSECDRHVLCAYDSICKGIATSTCPEEDVISVALLYIPWRSFPTEVTIADAEYTLRGSLIPDTSDLTDLPYYYPMLQDGVYAGISDRKKHFNRLCPEHSTTE